MSGIDAVLISIIPSIGVGLIFWYVMRGIMRADRREREELARIDAQDAAREAQAKANAEKDSVPPITN
jgi:hypothetical protein